jgi:hypothetical protein
VDKHVATFLVDHKPVAHPAIEPLHNPAFHGEVRWAKAPFPPFAPKLFLSAHRSGTHNVRVTNRDGIDLGGLLE